MRLIMYWIHSVVLLNILLVNCVNPELQVGNIRFCDGDKLVKLTGNQCSGGINFGDRKPDCVCMTGIYRFWMDTCLLHEGYSFNGCSTLVSWDDASDPHVNQVIAPYEVKRSSEVIGLQFAIGSADSINSLVDETYTVFSVNDTDYEPLTVLRANEKGITSSSKIYYVNSEVHIQGSESDPSVSRSICVGKSSKPSKKKLCQLDRLRGQGDATSTNKWLPHFDPHKIDVRDTPCKDKFPPGGFSHKLIPTWCYDLIIKSNSECSLSCAPYEGRHRNTTDKTGENGSDSGEVNTKSPTDRGTGDGEDNDEGGTKRTMRPPTNRQTSPEMNLKDCKQPTIGEVKDQHNSFLNRKLNHWSKLRQVGQLDKPMLSKIKPTRTFAILDIVKQIAQKTCPSQFVSPMFFDQALDLFVILHKGREYRYTEDLLEKDALWIEKILHNCNMDSKSIRLYAEDSGETGCDDFERAQGYCKSGSMETNDCEQVPLNISSDHKEFKYHFVVDAAWNLIDLIQIVCFDKFAESYRMFHAWEQSSEKLFTREIRKLWVQPKLDKKVYQNLLTPTAVVDMHNLEMCIEAAYSINPVLTRLLRPPEPKRFFRRKKRSTDDGDRIGTNYDVFCRKNPDDFYTPC